MLYDAFQQSYCSIEVKGIVRDVAVSYGLLEEVAARGVAPERAPTGGAPHAAATARVRPRDLPGLARSRVPGGLAFKDSAG